MFHHRKENNISMNYSVVTTIFNDAKIIRRFLDDIISQTVKPAEIIIADGGSSDDVEIIIDEYRKKQTIPIIFLFGKRLNIPQGFNEAIRASHEDLVMITSVGNRYYPTCFEKLLHQLQSNDVSAAYPVICGSEETAFSKIYNQGILRHRLVMDTPSNHGAMIKKSVINKLGYFYENFAYAGEDLEFYLRFKNMGEQSICVKDEYITWDVPTNNSEFLKQIKVYTIGEMQIFYNTRIIKKIIKNSLFFLLPIGSILLFFLSSHFIMKTTYMVLFIMCAADIIRRIAKFSFCGWLLFMEQKFMQIIYCFMNYKYFFDGNKISKSRRLR